MRDVDRNNRKRWTNVISDSLVLFCLHVTLPSGASELTTLWASYGVIQIRLLLSLLFFTPVLNSQEMKKIHYAITKSAKINLE